MSDQHLKFSSLARISIFFMAIFFSANAFGQRIHSDSQVILDNQKNPDIIEINQLWKDYLASSPDSLYDNPHWNKTEKEKFSSYDLLRSEGGLRLYSLAKDFSVVKNLVLSIKPIDDRHYDIHSMYYWMNPNDCPYILCTTHVLAFRDKSGKFVLGNWLPYYSRNWKTVNEGVITFHYQEYDRNNKKIKKVKEFLAFLDREFNVKIDHLDIFISNGFSQTQRLKGFGYDASETGVSDKDDLGATTDIDNNIIYSNSAMGEYYQHEMMRLIIPKYRNAHPLLLNGLAEYYSDTAVMRGVSFQEHFRRLDKFLGEHPDINLKEFDNIDSGNLTESNYLIGMVIIKLIDDRCGHQKILEALKTVHTDDDLRNLIDKELKINVDDIDSVLRALIKHYASNGFRGRQWR